MSTATTNVSESEPNGKSSQPSTKRLLTPPVTKSEREELLRRLMRTAASDTCPTAANLQLAGGDLLEISLQLKDYIKQSMDAGMEAKSLSDLKFVLDPSLKTNRQAERFLRLQDEITREASERRGH